MNNPPSRTNTRSDKEYSPVARPTGRRTARHRREPVDSRPIPIPRIPPFRENDTSAEIDPPPNWFRPNDTAAKIGPCNRKGQTPLPPKYARQARINKSHLSRYTRAHTRRLRREKGAGRPRRVCFGIPTCANTSMDLHSAGRDMLQPMTRRVSCGRWPGRHQYLFALCLLWCGEYVRRGGVRRGGAHAFPPR